ncbi:hypothetical protein CK203_068841 [Vitis vinifera]|uniref:Uncharacterized protein n=1 Tax=Vitis vinifera TaxID=29760 RepID=A0A438EY15_VITVI|nr:hypothetical protein CK203_068841 [Vitis vinifera]
MKNAAKGPARGQHPPPKEICFHLYYEVKLHEANLNTRAFGAEECDAFGRAVAAVVLAVHMTGPGYEKDGQMGSKSHHQTARMLADQDGGDP